MTGKHYRCPLGQWQGQPRDAEAVKREGWRDQGILVINTEDQRLDWAERQILKQIAERLYGRREVSHG